MQSLLNGLQHYRLATRVCANKVSNGLSHFCITHHYLIRGISYVKPGQELNAFLHDGSELVCRRIDDNALEIHLVRNYGDVSRHYQMDFVSSAWEISETFDKAS